MQHYGDITKINGHKVPLVDVVCGGSPCQDLSVAGQRKGLSGERSGLFMEQIRIVKEMRDESVRQLRSRGAVVDFRCVQPRYMVWENVPGAFSSNKGEDFRCVLEEICRIADKTATVPMPKDGRWSSSGCIVGNGWSVAWRVHDAQFWGVPQRRKRIALVADFGSESAAEILFERKSLSGNFESCEEKGQGSSTTTRGSSEDTISFQERAGCEGGARESSSNTNEQEHCQPLTIKASCLQDNGETNGTDLYNSAYGHAKAIGVDSYNLTTTGTVSKTLQAERADNEHVPCTIYSMGHNERSARFTVGVDAYNQAVTGDKAMSITGAATDSHHIPCVTVSQDAYDKFSENEKSASLKACGGTYGGGQRSISDTVGALCRCDYKGVGNQYVAEGKCIIQNL